MKPWQERWSLETETVDATGEECSPAYLVRDEGGTERPIVAELWSEPHARVVVVAPKMVTLLLRLVEATPDEDVELDDVREEARRLLRGIGALPVGGG